MTWEILMFLIFLIGNENMDRLIDQVQTYAHEVIDAGKKIIKREKWGTSWYSKELLEIKKELKDNFLHAIGQWNLIQNPIPEIQFIGFTRCEAEG